MLYLHVNASTSSPHIVHVVSMLDVPNRFGSTSFQSKDVSGAQKSEFLFCENKESITYMYSNFFLVFHNPLPFPECSKKLPNISVNVVAGYQLYNHVHSLKVSAKLIAFQGNMPRRFPQYQPFPNDRFCPENFRKFPAKSDIFFCKFDSENLTIFDFFLLPIRSPE